MPTPCILVAPAPAESVADADITAAVNRLLGTTRGVGSQLIEVTTHEGVVALGGRTDSLLMRQRTEQLALAVRGVRGVASRLVIEPANITDAALRRDVEQALAGDPATTGCNVRCAVAAGVVTPRGTVPSWPAKQVLLRVLAAVRGVRRIETKQLSTGKGKVRTSDEEITLQIRALLDWDLRVDSALVGVHTAGQAVRLTGTVGTAVEKACAVTTAYQVGAARVDARALNVAPRARAPRSALFAAPADADVARAVRAALRHAPGALLATPLVQAHGGMVTLAGTVGSLRAKLNAERDAGYVTGVVGVHNLLRVHPDRTATDGDTEEAIGAALARHPDVAHCALIVRVHEGKASLSGQVKDHFEWRQAGDVAAGVRGVLELDNQAVVPPPAEEPLSPQTAGFQRSYLGDDALRPVQPATDAVLTARIRSRYCWSAALHNQEVNVAVEAGRATLTGTVDTRLDRQQAARDAYEAGARDVVNHLRVTTAPWLKVETGSASSAAVMP